MVSRTKDWDVGSKIKAQASGEDRFLPLYKYFLLGSSSDIDRLYRFPGEPSEALMLVFLYDEGISGLWFTTKPDQRFFVMVHLGSMEFSH